MLLPASIDSYRVRKSLSAAAKLLLVLAAVHSLLDYCNKCSLLTALVTFTAAPVCVKFGGAIDSWPRAIRSYYTGSY